MGAEVWLLDKNNDKFLDFQIRIVITLYYRGMKLLIQMTVERERKQVNNSVERVLNCKYKP